MLFNFFSIIYGTFFGITELQLGELVHHQKLFGLFEAMSAIEMMDPKMDAGMCCNKNPGGPLTFETAVNVSITFCSVTIYIKTGSFMFILDFLFGLVA